MCGHCRHGQPIRQGLSLRDLDRALSQIHEERRRVLLLIGLEGTSYEEREDTRRANRHDPLARVTRPRVVPQV